MSILNSGHFVKARTTLAQHKATALFVDRRGRPLNVPASDSDDMDVDADVNPFGAPLVYGLTYEDAKGDLSERTVTLKWIEDKGDYLILHCACHLRHQPRQFRTDRVVEIFDITSGEIFDDPFSFFATHPIFTHPTDPEDVAIKMCRHELTILTMVGAADGLFDPEEQDHVLIHVFDRCVDLSLSEDRLRKRLALFAPDEHSFWAALNTMGQFKQGDSRLLLRTLRRLVDADGRHSPEEVAFVSEIQGRLGN